MSRYIDAKWLMKYFERGKDYKGEYVLDDLKYDAPSIDIVPCKECKYWSGCKSTMHNNHLCSRAENVDYWTRADDFCSYGEREEEDIPMEYFENGGI